MINQEYSLSAETDKQQSEMMHSLDCQDLIHDSYGTAGKRLEETVNLFIVIGELKDWKCAFQVDYNK